MTAIMISDLNRFDDVCSFVVRGFLPCYIKPQPINAWCDECRKVREELESTSVVFDAPVQGAVTDMAFCTPDLKVCGKPREDGSACQQMLLDGKCHRCDWPAEVPRRDCISGPGLGVPAMEPLPDAPDPVPYSEQAMALLKPVAWMQSAAYAWQDHAAEVTRIADERGREIESLKGRMRLANNGKENAEAMRDAGELHDSLDLLKVGQMQDEIETLKAQLAAKPAPDLSDLPDAPQLAQVNDIEWYVDNGNCAHQEIIDAVKYAARLRSIIEGLREENERLVLNVEALDMTVVQERDLRKNDLNLRDDLAAEREAREEAEEKARLHIAAQADERTALREKEREVERLEIVVKEKTDERDAREQEVERLKSTRTVLRVRATERALEIEAQEEVMGGLLKERDAAQAAQKEAERASVAFREMLVTAERERDEARALTTERRIHKVTWVEGGGLPPVPGVSSLTPEEPLSVVWKQDSHAVRIVVASALERVRVLEGALRSIAGGAEPGISAEALDALALTTPPDDPPAETAPHTDFTEHDGGRYLLCPICEEECGCAEMDETCGHCPGDEPAETGEEAATAGEAPEAEWVGSRHDGLLVGTLTQEQTDRLPELTADPAPTPEEPPKCSRCGGSGKAWDGAPGSCSKCHGRVTEPTEPQPSPLCCEGMAARGVCTCKPQTAEGAERVCGKRLTCPDHPATNDTVSGDE